MKLIVLTCVLLMISACASHREIADVQLPVSVNPPLDKAIRFVRITDLRQFEPSPDDPATPSLTLGDIANADIKSRAYARMVNRFGKVEGDVALPEGRSVMAVVKEALTKALRESGYRVLEAADPDYDTAIPIEVDIQRFWGWLTVGYEVVPVNFEARVIVTGNFKPFEKGLEIKGSAVVEVPSITATTWNETVNAALDVMMEDTKGHISNGLRRH